MPTLIIMALCAALLPTLSAANTFLRMQTDLGGVDIELFDTAAPNTVLNFLEYVNADYYNGTFISRRTDPTDPQTGFGVLQMGGYVFDPNRGTFTSNLGIYHIPVDLTDPVLGVPLETGISNTRGTLAMARGAATNSAASDFFFNLTDNNIDDPANNKTSLDTLNGGYAVFGQVVAGIEVIDAVAALQTCKDIGYILPAPCNGFPNVPLIDIYTVNGDGGVFTTPIQQGNLVNFNNIGTDGDGDGIIDKVEDAAPNAGDGNNDSFQDSTQASVASFQGNSGNYVTLVTNPGISLSDTVVLGNTFFLTTQDPTNVLDQIGFLDAIFGTTLTGVTTAATVEVTLPATSVPNTYFLYGSTLSDNQPHWYEFDYDGETGAQLSGNQVILYFVDGKRGDNDLQVNGIIEKSPGAPARRPGDSDGIPDAVEDAGPNNGDGNSDNIPDSTQDYVVSLPDPRGRYLTLETSSRYTLSGTAFTLAEAILTIPLPTGQRIANPAIASALLEGANFTHDFLQFDLGNVASGDSADVRIILPAGETPFRFLKYGPEPSDASDHVYDFAYDQLTGTGAEFSGNEVILHFVDGGRGDADLMANGVISDPGAVALPAPVASTSGGGGGCSLQTTSGSPWQAGAWWLLGLCLLPVAVRRAYRHLH